MSGVSNDLLLLGVLHHAPQLINMLDSKSIQSLLSCGRQSRHIVHSKAATIRLSLDTSDARHGWTLQTMKCLSRGGWQGLQHLELNCWPDVNEEDNFPLECCVGQLRMPAVSEMIKNAWPQLRSLSLRFGVLHNRAIGRLVTAKWHNLSTLHLSNTVLTADAMQALCRAPWPLQVLSLRNTMMDSDALAHLYDSNWPNLSSLNLDCNQDICASQSVFWDVFKASRTHLNMLSLQQVAISAEAMMHLAAFQSCSLQVLDVSDAWFSNDALLALAQGGFTKLRSLDISNTEWDLSAIEALRHARWPELDELYFGGCQLQSQHIPMMSAMVTSCCQLSRIVLTNCFVNPDDVCTLLTQGKWHSLQSLSLAGNNLHANQIAVLATIPLPKLQRLNVSSNSLCEAAVESLLSADWPYLEDLNIQGNWLGAGDTQLISGLGCRMKRLKMTISSMTDMQGMFERSTEKNPLAFEQILLTACTSLILKCDCHQLSLHLDADLQRNCGDIALKMPGFWSGLGTYYPNLLDAYEFEFPSNGQSIFEYLPHIQFLQFDFHLLGKWFEVAIDCQSKFPVYLVWVALYPLNNETAI